MSLQEFDVKALFCCFFFLLVGFYVTQTLQRLYGDFPTLLVEKDLRSPFVHYFRHKWAPEQNHCQDSNPQWWGTSDSKTTTTTTWPQKTSTEQGVYSFLLEETMACPWLALNPCGYPTFRLLVWHIDHLTKPPKNV